MGRVAVISDLHIPYINEKAVENAIRHIKNEKATHLIIAGDFMDCESISKFSKPFKKRDFGKEVAITKQWVSVFSKLKIPVDFIIGNHCRRLEKFIYDKVPEFSGLPELDIRNLLELPAMWQVIPFNTHIVVNKVVVKHGEKCGQSVLQQNLNYGVSSVQGHSHRLSLRHRRLYNGKIISAAEIGCLCNLNADYLEHNDWCHGMCFIENNGYIRLMRL